MLYRLGPPHLSTVSPWITCCRSVFYRLPLFFSSTTNVNSFEEKWIPVIRAYDRMKSEDWDKQAEKRSYVLAMFPYPSGSLHLGHLRVYCTTDVLFRYQSMLGKATLQPMGWDAFGLPAENAAIDHGVLPASWTEKNTTRMRQQFESTMILGLDMSRELSTCDPSYYRWTQWLFLQLYKAGLAYRRSAFVNWDPVDQTVLADELIDGQGRSWRSGAIVERRFLRQWYFRTTQYSKSLLDGLTEIENNQWRDVVKMQRGWLGTLDGTQMEFDIAYNHSFDASSRDSNLIGERLIVFTKHPGLAVADLISHIDVGPGSVYFEEQFRMPEDQREFNNSRKLLLCHHHCVHGGEGPFKLTISSVASSDPWPEQLAVIARHPFSGRAVPMIRQPQAIQCQTTAFPDKLCFHLKAEKHPSVSSLLDLAPPPTMLRHMRPNVSAELVIPTTVSLTDVDNYVLSTPVTELDGVPVSESTEKAMQMLRDTGRGGHWTSELRTDWLVSRQRYWGTPIPVVHCQSCGIVPVPEDQLPVVLPSLDHPLKRGDSPLVDNLSWRRTECPKCGAIADRETDTLDTFVDSSWYYLRFLDPHNDRAICDPDKAARGLPVNIYVGGIEHAIRHLYYARFMSHFLHDLGVTRCREPFLRFLPIGLILGQTFVEPHSGRHIPSDKVQVTTSEKGKTVWLEKDTSLPLRMEWDKMSKSKLNGVDPSDVVKVYGIELVRLAILSNVGPHRVRKWQEDGILQGLINWRTRLLRLVDDVLHHVEQLSSEHSSWILLHGPDDPLQLNDTNLRSTFENTIHRVNTYYNETFVLSAVIARLQELTDILRRSARFSNGPGASSFLHFRSIADLVVMLAPMSPILACELWSRLQLAYQMQAAVPARERLSGLSDSPPGTSFLDCWPYDLEKLVLEQPFPQCVNDCHSVSTPDIATQFNSVGNKRHLAENFS